MDAVHKRYTHPFPLLDSYISRGRFTEFITTLEEIIHEEEEWEYYIHKLPPWDERSFDEFQSGLKKTTTIEEIPSNEVLTTTIRYSHDILNNFKIE